MAWAYVDVRSVFQTAADRLFASLVTPQTRADAERGTWPAAVWSACEEAGFTIGLVPEKLGGVGAGLSEIFPVILAAGRYAVPLPLIETMAANYLLGLIECEPVSGVVTVSADTLMLRDGKVSGSLRSVPWAHSAYHLLATATDGRNPPQLVLLTTASGSLTHRDLNIAREPRDGIILKDAMPILVRDLPHGFGEESLLLMGALMRAAQMVGALEAACDLSIHYANERRQFGRPIAKFQAIQHLMAQLAAETSLARVAVDAAFQAADFSSNGLSIPTAKIIAGEAATKGARHAHSIHGAIGISHAYNLNFFTRRLWSWRTEFGSASFWSKKLGVQAAARGADAMWPAITRGRWTSNEA